MCRKKQECVELRANAEEANLKVKQAEEGMKQVGLLKTMLKESETAIKVQDEELKNVKSKLAQSLSELGQEKANADMSLSMVEELTRKVQELGAERAGLITEVILYVCRALVDSDELGQWIGQVISCNRDDERAMILKEFGEKGLVNLQERDDYDPNVAVKIEKAVQDYRCAEFPFVEKLSSDPLASYHELLAIKPGKIQQAPVSAPPGSSAHIPPQDPPVDDVSAA